MPTASVRSNVAPSVRPEATPSVRPELVEGGCSRRSHVPPSARPDASVPQHRVRAVSQGTRQSPVRPDATSSVRPELVEGGCSKRSHTPPSARPDASVPQHRVRAVSKGIRQPGRVLFSALTCLTLASPLQAQTPDQASIERGKALLQNRQATQCLLCHTAPVPNPHLQGNLGPSLVRIGSKYTGEELRERIAHPQRFNPQTIMPRYGEASPAERVGSGFVGKPILSEGELGDLVAFLFGLR